MILWEMIENVKSFYKLPNLRISFNIEQFIIIMYNLYSIRKNYYFLSQYIDFKNQLA